MKEDQEKKKYIKDLIPDSKFGKITLNEIWQIPKSIRKTLDIEKDKIFSIAQKIIELNCVSFYILGSGTSYHAGLVSTYWFSQLCKMPAHCELAPEFSYLVEPIIAPKHCVICISQSGESKLTIQAAKVSKEQNAFVIAITNTEKSQITQYADYTILMKAGIEKSVLATKTYITELVVLTALALDLAFLKKKIGKDNYENLWNELISMPKLIEDILPIYQKDIQKIAPYFKFAKHCFVISAGPDYANCLEIALKLKEGARIFAQAYSTAEFPHGPITLAESHSAFVLVIIPRKEALNRHKDVLKLISRLKERGITILAIKESTDNIEEIDINIDMPKCSEFFQPILSIIPVQLLVVEIAIIQNINPDNPKYLSKVAQL
ncbi:MAG: SIS domain-containing protein [Candidatus Lokiarchaeota archaeon]|nr:SIS domain-containing protein [Candidatus Lokiarchaeota archaeon]